ncbi:hypothetical protein [Streptomyces sp. NPDC005955]|uniref:hypothetical protein n=1 Tax=Streptomyces sp. NPDC005955 TaxID=3364738 RepID=UPI0036C1371B
MEPVEALPQKGTSVERRAFLTDAAGVAASTSLPTYTRPVTPPGSSGAIGVVHLLELREGLNSLFVLDAAYGGSDVLRLAVRHLHRVRRVLNEGRPPEAIARQLHLLVSETAGFCGWLAYDAEDQNAARRYWGEALAAATMVQDAHLQAYVFGFMSLQARHENRPREAVDLARAAQERAARLDSPALRSIMAAREAGALSFLADASGASKKLAESRRLLDRPRGRPAPEWAAFHGHAELDNWEASLHINAGRHNAAIPFLRQTLARQDQMYGRNRALYRIRLATTLVKAGEIDEGAAHAVETIPSLEEVESGRVAKEISKVTNLLRWQDADCARQAVACLTDYVRATGAA